MSDNYFFVLAILILHRFELALYAYDVVKKKMGRKCNGILFIFSWHVRYCMYFCLIPQFTMH
jgi:hypothetical protein